MERELTGALHVESRLLERSYLQSGGNDEEQKLEPVGSGVRGGKKRRVEFSQVRLEAHGMATQHLSIKEAAVEGERDEL